MFPIARNIKWTRGLVAFGVTVMMNLAAFGQQPKHALTNEEITKMVKGGFTDDVIVALIESNDIDFDVSIGGLTALKEAGVSGKVMEAMLKAEARKRQAPGSTTGATAATSAPAASAPPAATAGPPGFDPQAMQAMVTNMMPDMSTMISPQAMKHMPKAMRQQMMQQMMQQKMMKAAMGMNSPYFPHVLLESGDAKQMLRPATTQIAEVPKNGSALGAAGSALASPNSRAILQTVGMQALSFAAIGAGPAGMVGMGVAS